MSRLLTVFAALFITAVAICGSMNSSATGLVTEEPKVLNQENVAGPIDIELLADCSNEKAGKSRAHGRCHKTTFRDIR